MTRPKRGEKFPVDDLESDSDSEPSPVSRGPALPKPIRGSLEDIDISDDDCESPSPAPVTKQGSKKAVTKKSQHIDLDSSDDESDSLSPVPAKKKVYLSVGSLWLLSQHTQGHTIEISHARCQILTVMSQIVLCVFNHTMCVKPCWRWVI